MVVCHLALIEGGLLVRLFVVGVAVEGVGVVASRSGRERLSRPERVGDVSRSHYLQVVVVVFGSGSLGGSQIGRGDTRRAISHHLLVGARLVFVDQDPARSDVQGRVLIVRALVAVIGVLRLDEDLGLLGAGGMAGRRSSSLATTAVARGLGRVLVAARSGRSTGNCLALSQILSILLDPPELELDPVGSRVSEVLVDL